MKISLNVEADSVNALALNMGKIAVEVDGVEIDDIINIANDNGYSLAIADEPGQVVIHSPQKPSSEPTTVPEWVGGLRTCGYDDRFRHLVANFPHGGGWKTLCGMTNEHTPERHKKSRKHRFDCPDCNEVLNVAQRTLSDNAAQVSSVCFFRGIQCSIAHITERDNTLLHTLSQQFQPHSDTGWIHCTGSGYLIHLDAWPFPVLRLKREGLSKTARRLIITLMRQYNIGSLHLDASEVILPGFVTFNW